MKDIMKRIMVFVFILLATLSIEIVNAVTIFEKYPDPFPPDVFPLTVTIKPDPPIPGAYGIFEVSGKLSKATSNADLAIGFSDSKGKMISKHFLADICVVNNGCPATSINAEIGQVPVPSILPKPYAILVFVSERTAGSATEALACAVAWVGLGA
jgi:hypothetical protein